MHTCARIRMHVRTEPAAAEGSAGSTPLLLLPSVGPQVEAKAATSPNEEGAPKEEDEEEDGRGGSRDEGTLRLPNEGGASKLMGEASKEDASKLEGASKLCASGDGVSKLLTIPGPISNVLPAPSKLLTIPGPLSKLPPPSKLCNEGTSKLAVPKSGGGAAAASSSLPSATAPPRGDGWEGWAGAAADGAAGRAVGTGGGGAEEGGREEAVVEDTG